jgi:hypothetical protein
MKSKIIRKALKRGALENDLKTLIKSSQAKWII